METLQEIKNVAACDVHEVGDLLVCSDCAPIHSTPAIVRYQLTDLVGWCDYCGRDLTAPRMFDSTPHAL